MSIEDQLRQVPCFTVELFEPCGTPMWAGVLCNSVGKKLAVICAPQLGRVMDGIANILNMEVPTEHE